VPRTTRTVRLAAIATAAIAFPFVFAALNPPQLRAHSLQAAQADNAPLPTFDVASIKKHVPDANGGKEGVTMGGPDISQFRATNVTAKMLIETAYNVNDFQIAGGPAWIDSEHWDINAKVGDSLVAQLEKLPHREQQAQQALMVRSLLLDRFKLQVTRSTKDGNVLALVVAKGGPKLKEVAPPNPQASGAPPPAGPIAPGQPRGPAPGQALLMMNNNLVTLAANGVPIASLVNQLSMQIGEKVADQTGLKGTYQYTLQFAPQRALGDMHPPPAAEAAAPDSDTSSIFTALQEQLGLKLQSTKGSIDTITIDQIQQPSPN
jgi:uncharacterized protein (TIGR03435 family)